MRECQVAATEYTRTRYKRRRQLLIPETRRSFPYAYVIICGETSGSLTNVYYVNSMYFFNCASERGGHFSIIEKPGACESPGPACNGSLEIFSEWMKSGWRGKGDISDSTKSRRIRFGLFASHDMLRICVQLWVAFHVDFLTAAHHWERMLTNCVRQREHTSTDLVYV